MNHNPLSRARQALAQSRATKWAARSTPAGNARRWVVGAVAIVCCLVLTSCTYSDGSSMSAESLPHTHGKNGVAHPVGAHNHTSAGDGLAASLHGYTLEAVQLRDTGQGGHLSFRVRSPSGAPQLQYSLDHGKLLHLYVVSEDLSAYHHEHPVIDSSGYWQVDLSSELAPGVQHVVASFVAIDRNLSEHALVLGTDLLVDGTPEHTPLPAAVPEASVDGLQVRLEGAAQLTQPSQLTLSITRNGRPAELTPYLDSWAHVTAVEAASRALDHLHPAAIPRKGTPAPARIELSFTAPAPGQYRFFIDFATAEGLHRVAFTRTVFG